jgi:hypothetical protein
LLPHDPRSDIVRKHPASRFIFTTDVDGQWEPSDEGETDMTSVVVAEGREIRELTIDDLDQASGGVLPLFLVVALGVGAGLTYAAGLIAGAHALGWD